MISFDSFYSRGNSFTFENVFNNLFDVAPITDAQKYHLTRVYSTLAFSSLITFLTVAFNGPWIYLGPFIGMIFVVSSIVYIFATKTTGNDFDWKRFLALGVFSMSLGIIHRDFIRVLFNIRPDLVNTALMASVGIFASFSIASLFIKQRSYIYLAGLVFSLSCYITIVQITNIFFMSYFVRNVTMFLLIVLMIGYVAIDTQSVLKSVETNTHDVVGNALLLYIDLFTLFLRVLEFISREERNKKRKQKENEEL